MPSIIIKRIYFFLGLMFTLGFFVLFAIWHQTEENILLLYAFLSLAIAGILAFYGEKKGLLLETKGMIKRKERYSERVRLSFKPMGYSLSIILIALGIYAIFKANSLNPGLTIIIFGILFFLLFKFLARKFLKQ